MRSSNDLNDLPVIHARNAIGKIEDTCVVGDDNEGSVRTLRNASQDLHHAAPGLVIQIAGRLVANDELRAVHQRTCDCHALLLPTAKLGRECAQARAEPNCSESFSGPGFRPILPSSINQKRYCDILKRSEGWQQVEDLKDKADGYPTKMCPLPLIHLPQIVSKHFAFAGILVEYCCYNRN